MKIQIKAGLEIGDHSSPFIIAEVGSNWSTLDDCLHSIAMAKACGADAVKFQAFTRKALFGLPHLMENWGGAPGELPLDWLPKLKVHSDAIGIEFMCSAFSPELVDAVNPYVNIHKVASAELSHVRILERIKAHGKPVIVSTGASGEQDIRMALEVLSGVPVILMYCVAAYPARLVHFGGIHWLRETFGTLVGFSDHTTDALVIPAASTAYGACVIEKHVQFVDGNFPDTGHSLALDEFKAMVGQLRGGKPFAPIGIEEMEMIKRHNRRLIATRDIQAGDEFKEGENFGIYRSLKDDTHALTPFAISSVAGKSAKRAIKAGDGIGPGDF